MTQLSQVLPDNRPGRRATSTAAYRRIGIITPSFHTLGRTWRRDPQIIKLAAPQISGALVAAGFGVRQYDFEVEIFRLEYESPGRLNLRAFFDDASVDRFLASDDPTLREQTELILDSFAVEAADLFACSCASVLEIYADMHAVANLNMCLIKVLKERFPACKTMIGGLKISPDSKHRAEFISMLERCRDLDFAGQGRGESIVLDALEYLNTGRSFDEIEVLNTGKTLAEIAGRNQRHGHGWLLHSSTGRELHLPPGLARELGIETNKGYVAVAEDADEVPVFKQDGASGGPAAGLAVPLSSTTGQVLSALAEANRRKEQAARLAEEVEFGPQGDHKRRAIFNPSIFITPWFDKRNTENRKISGRKLMERYHLHGPWEERLGPYADDRVAILPMIFMEGCNARCAFCSYSMTSLVKREAKEVVRAMAWMREEYDIKFFHFLNTNINGSLQYAEAFCDELIDAKLDVFWSDCANLWALNDRLLEKMRRSGAMRFTYGVECPSDRMLDYIGKGITVKQAHERLKQASDLGIWNHLLLITGLPTETEEDTKHFIDFLERSAEYSNAYSISSFYLISSSLMGAFPERYGLEMIPNPTGLLEDQAFDEKSGLPWAQKKRQIVRSTEIITNAIKRIKKDPKYWSGAIDLELLFWLYDRLGHDNKAEIVRCYEDAFLGPPAHVKTYVPAMKGLLGNPEGVSKILRQGGMIPRPDEIRIDGETLYLPVETAARRIDLEFRVLGFGASASFTSSRNLGTSLSLDDGFGQALAAMVAPESELAQAVARTGWRISANESRPNGTTSFRLERERAAVDVAIAPMGPNDQAFMKHEGLGLVYRVPHDREDPTKQPRAMQLVQRVGTFLLQRLAADPRTQQARAIDMNALRQFAHAIVGELEAVYARELDFEQMHDAAQPGRRHGDKFSRVAAA